jgi:hypothetical protein
VGYPLNDATVRVDEEAGIKIREYRIDGRSGRNRPDKKEKRYPPRSTKGDQGVGEGSREIRRGWAGGIDFHQGAGGITTTGSAGISVFLHDDGQQVVFHE